MYIYKYIHFSAPPSPCAPQVGEVAPPVDGSGGARGFTLYLSIYLSIYISIYPFIRLSIYLSIYLSINIYVCI